MGRPKHSPDAGGTIYRTESKPDGDGQQLPEETPHLRLVRDPDWDIEEQSPEGVRAELGFETRDGTEHTFAAPVSPLPPTHANGHSHASAFVHRRSEVRKARTPTDIDVAEVMRQLDELNAENAMLRAEVHHLRRRDDTVNYTMNRIDEELRLAAKLQRDFMPKTLPSLGRAHFHSLFRPAGYVSGDLYEVARLDERHVGFFVADAVGHGMPAALLTMFMRQALQTKEIANNSYRLLRPGETLSRLNAVMVEQDLSQATFATAVCGVINVETGMMMVASAGHPRPLLLPKGGEARELMTDGSLLGIFPDGTFDDVTVKLNSGDRLVLYTDGVEVAFPKAGPNEDDQMHYDNDKWREVLLGMRGDSAEGMLLGLSGAIDAQIGSLSPGDDLTVILLEMDE